MLNFKLFAYVRYFHIFLPYQFCFYIILMELNEFLLVVIFSWFHCFFFNISSFCLVALYTLSFVKLLLASFQSNSMFVNLYLKTVFHFCRLVLGNFHSNRLNCCFEHLFYCSKCSFSSAFGYPNVDCLF